MIRNRILCDGAEDYSSYKAFIYRYTLIKDTPSPTNPKKILKKGTWYYGSHLGDIDDPYWESCENEDFRILFASPEEFFDLEIIALYEKYSVAKMEEDMHLRENAKEVMSDMSFNGHTGFMKKDMFIDRDKVKKFVNEINKRTESKWPITYEDKKDHKGDKVRSLQVRDKDDKKHQSDIKDLINDANGVVDLDKNPNIDPVVICQDRQLEDWDDTDDTRIDGNMTTGAITNRGCKATHVPVMRIPVEDHSHLNENELRHASYMLNRSGKKKRKNTDVDDATKFIFDRISQMGKYEHDTKPNRDMIEHDYDLSRQQVKKVMSNVTDRIYEHKQSQQNMVYIDYTDAEKEAYVSELKELHEDTIIFFASALMADKIPARLLTEIQKDVEQSKCDDREPYKKIIIAVHFSQSKTARDDWRINLWPSLAKQWENLNSDYSLDYEEFDLTRSDTK